MSPLNSPTSFFFFSIVTSIVYAFTTFASPEDSRIGEQRAKTWNFPLSFFSTLKKWSRDRLRRLLAGHSVESSPLLPRVWCRRPRLLPRTASPSWRDRQSPGPASPSGCRASRPRTASATTPTPSSPSAAATLCPSTRSSWRPATPASHRRPRTRTRTSSPCPGRCCPTATAASSTSSRSGGSRGVRRATPCGRRRRRWTGAWTQRGGRVPRSSCCPFCALFACALPASRAGPPRTFCPAGGVLVCPPFCHQTIDTSTTIPPNMTTLLH